MLRFTDVVNNHRVASQSLPGDLSQKDSPGKGIVITWVRNSTHLGYGCLGYFLFASRSIPSGPSLLGGLLYKKRELCFLLLSLASQFGNLTCVHASMDTATPGTALLTGYSIYWVTETAYSPCPFRSRG